MAALLDSKFKETGSIRNKCNRCKIDRAKPSHSEMAPLSVERLAAYTRPFTFVGVDYFGPINVTVGRRVEKRWGVLFTCLTIRAVHIEIAHTLSTDSCITAIRNFITRRDTPKVFYSDNGTNFKGAEKELGEAFQRLDQDAMYKKFTTIGTEWKFIPPLSPHMGGSWERLIGAVKKVLCHICQHQLRFNDENLRCFLMEAEGVLNSRPLTHVSLEKSDSEAFTPNHFLLGTSDGNKPPGVFDTKDIYLRKGWRMAQQLANVFWRKWLVEWLENLPRNTWPKGIVVHVTKGQDGQIRRATVRTTKGVFDRPAVKLAIFDVVEGEDVLSSHQGGVLVLEALDN